MGKANYQRRCFNCGFYVHRDETLRRNGAHWCRDCWEMARDLDKAHDQRLTAIQAPKAA